MQDKNLIDLYNLRRRFIKEGYSKDLIDEISFIIECKENFLKEDVSATGGISTCGSGPVSMGVSVPGMGPISSPQPSAFPGSTMGPNYVNGGGRDGSGDIGFPLNMGPKGVYSKTAAPNGLMNIGRTKEHGGVSAKRNRRSKKLNMKSLKNIFAKKQDYTSGQGERKTSRVMNFDNFAKNQFNKITKNSQ